MEATIQSETIETTETMEYTISTMMILQKQWEECAIEVSKKPIFGEWKNLPNTTGEHVIYFMQSLKKMDEDLLKEYKQGLGRKLFKKMAWGRRRIRNFEIFLPRTAYKNLMFGHGHMDMKKR